MDTTARRMTALLVAAALLLGAGCGDKSPHATAAPSPSPDAGVEAPAFAAVGPEVYVAKVKNLLVGLPPTEAEIAAVQADPAALRGEIDEWLKAPQYRTKLLSFFELAFQQTQVAIDDFADQTYPRQAVLNPAARPLLLANLTESFARTALALVDEGKPFSDAITTRRFMMTPALMEFYAFLDAFQVDDDGTTHDRFAQAFPKLQIYVEAKDGPIPLEQSLDTSSPNYMHFYNPAVGNTMLLGDGCSEDPIVYKARADVLHLLLLGSLLTHKNAAGTACKQYGGTANSLPLPTSDFTDWRMVTIRAPGTGETRSAFYDLPALRKASELVLTTPRVGFLTPAFFANWPTNISNQMRVTLNQALIVATSTAIDGDDPTSPSSTPGLDSAHAGSSDCIFCHRTLDPTRSILASTYSWNYHDQDSSAFSSQHGLFVYRGVEQPVADIGEFAAALVNHPLFAGAWVQKLCYYANSEPCDSKDPEFTRIVGAFRSSNYDWSALMRDFFSSPLTTYASATTTTQHSGGVVAVARRDHLCAALNARLGFGDICAAAASSTTKRIGTVVQIAAGLPSDGYGRGAAAPVLPTRPTLFYRAGLENLCEAIAKQVVDPPAMPADPNARHWASTAPDDAIVDFVELVAGLPKGDSRHNRALALLQAHFAAARAQKARPTDALRSTFIVACLAPTAQTVGM